MERRAFLKATLAAMAAGDALLGGEFRWGGPVLDTHLHLRPDPDACFTHIQGCGVTNAVLLTRAPDEDKAKQEIAKRPDVFVRSVSTDPAQPGADEVIRRAIQDGAVSLGELKYHLALDSPEMRRVYSNCAEMQVPVMMHIQNYPHFPGELPYNTGYPQFDRVLHAYPRTNFIGHGDLFWAHISADVPTDRGYPSGPIKPGGTMRGPRNSGAIETSDVTRGLPANYLGERNQGVQSSLYITKGCSTRRARLSAQGPAMPVATLPSCQRETGSRE